MANVIVRECPNCGSNLSADVESVCNFCGSAYMPKNLATLARMDRTAKLKYIASYREVLADHDGHVPVSISLAMCHIDAANYEFALKLLEKLADNNCTDPNVFYYISLALLGGRKPRVLHAEQIRKVESYLNSAQLLSGGNAIYYIAQAAIKADYYEFYLFNMHAGDSSRTLLEKANHHKLDADEIHQVLKLIGIDQEDRVYFDNALAI